MTSIWLTAKLPMVRMEQVLNGCLRMNVCIIIIMNVCIMNVCIITHNFSIYILSWFYDFLQESIRHLEH